MLGEFEHVLITGAAGLGDKAYGAAIREEIEAATGQNCSIGGLYTTLDQLETKGLITPWMAQRGRGASWVTERKAGAQ
jgi:PadR family transcriptional regulator PadR